MYEYVRGSFAGGMPRDLPTLVTLAGLFVMDVFEGPALALLTPFMGCSSCAVGAINLLAAAFFCKGEAVQHHWGQAIIRPSHVRGVQAVISEGVRAWP